MEAQSLHVASCSLLQSTRNMYLPLVKSFFRCWIACEKSLFVTVLMQWLISLQYRQVFWQAKKVIKQYQVACVQQGQLNCFILPPTPL